MNHILVLNTDDRGHVFPTLAIVTELVHRGHRVTYVTAGDVVEAVRQAGADVVPYEPGTAEKNREGTFDALLAGGIVTFLEDLGRIVAAGETALADDRPDLIVYDESLTHFGHRLARRWGRPAIRLLPIFAENEHYSAARVAFATAKVDPAGQRAFLGQIVATLTRLRVGVPLGEFLRQPAEELNLVLVPRAFQPAEETFGDEYVFVGPCTGTRPFLGTWTPPEDDLPVVLVSLGTNNAGTAFFRACVNAFANTSWHVVMSLGPNADPADLGDLPPNVEAHRWVPHLAVLPRASVVVTHGGTGSVMEALSHGCPMVVVPQPACTPVAEQVAALGLGRVVPAEEATAGRVREAVLALAADQGVRERAQWMEREIAAAGGAVRAADEIELRLSRSLGQPGS